MPKRRRANGNDVVHSSEKAARSTELLNGGRRGKRARNGQKDKQHKSGKTPSSTHKAFSKLHRRAGQGAVSLQDLPDNVLALIFRQLGLHRLRAVQVCKRWRALGNHPQFVTHVRPGHVNEAIAAAGVGDTLVLAPGFYQEILLIEKPLRLVGAPGQDLAGRPRKGVVIQSNRPMAVMCNARAYFENMVFRAILPSGDRSIIGFGPACNYVRLRACELGGITGLLVPSTRGPDTQLVLLDCYLHGVPHASAITMEGGRLRMQGCTVTNCQAAVNVLEGVEVDLRNNDLSFNEVALVFDGHGSVADNVMWGNLHRSTVDVTPDALQRAQQGEAGQPVGAAGGDAEAAGAGAAAPPAPAAAAPADANGGAPAAASVAAAAEPGEGGQPQQAAADGAPGGPAAGEDDGAGNAAGRRGRRREGQPPVVFSGNHVIRPARLRHLSAEQERIRRRARVLAAEVYGAHEQGGEWDDEGEWHLVNDGDFDSSDDDGLGGDDDGDSQGGGSDGGESSDEGGFAGLGDHDFEDDDGFSSFSEGEEDDSDGEGGPHGDDDSDSSMHTSEYETSDDEELGYEEEEQEGKAQAVGPPPAPPILAPAAAAPDAPANGPQ